MEVEGNEGVELKAIPPDEFSGVVDRTIQETIVQRQTAAIIFFNLAKDYDDPEKLEEAYRAITDANRNARLLQQAIRQWKKNPNQLFPISKKYSSSHYPVLDLDSFEGSDLSVIEHHHGPGSILELAENINRRKKN